MPKTISNCLGIFVELRHVTDTDRRTVGRTDTRQHIPRQHSVERIQIIQRRRIYKCGRPV